MHNTEQLYEVRQRLWIASQPARSIAPRLRTHAAVIERTLALPQRRHIHIDAPHGLAQLAVNLRQQFEPRRLLRRTVVGLRIVGLDGSAHDLGGRNPLQLAELAQLRHAAARHQILLPHQLIDRLIHAIIIHSAYTYTTYTQLCGRWRQLPGPADIDAASDHGL